MSILPTRGITGRCRQVAARLRSASLANRTRSNSFTGTHRASTQLAVDTLTPRRTWSCRRAMEAVSFVDLASIATHARGTAPPTCPSTIVPVAEFHPSPCPSLPLGVVSSMCAMRHCRSHHTASSPLHHPPHLFPLHPELTDRTHFSSCDCSAAHCNGARSWQYVSRSGLELYL